MGVISVTHWEIKLCYVIELLLTFLCVLTALVLYIYMITALVTHKGKL